jgi:hypothetical protein
VKLDWDGLLREMLVRAYSSQDAGKTDDDDMAVMAVLLSLHAAVQGEHDLIRLASACMDLSEGRKCPPPN